MVLVTGIFPPDIGGPATYVPRLGEALVQRGHSVAVVAASDTAGHEDAAYPFPVHRIARRPKLGRVLRVIGAIARQARAADVILANSMHLESLIAGRRAGCPVILKVAGDWAWERSRSRGWIGDDFETFQRSHYSPRVEALRRIRSAVARRANGVLAPSQYLAGWAREWGAPVDRVKVIYNAIEPAQVRSRAKLPWHGPTLLTVGRLVPWKHIDALIELLPELDGAGLVIAGEGPLRAALERRAAELNVTERTWFTGKCSRQEILDLMAACDLFVLNSSYEGLPHVVLEAMQMRLPVVATAVGGTAEVVDHGETGELVPAGDRALLLETLRRMLGSPELRARRANAATQRLERFTFKTMLDETENLLQQTASRITP